MKYSPTTGCFYPEDIEYTDLPTDLVDVRDEDYAACMARTADEVIVFQDGQFSLSKAAGPTDEEIKAGIKARARQLLAATDYTQTADVVVAITNADAFAQYRAEIREIFHGPMVEPIWPDMPDPIWA